jgi:hypothetical protein
MLIHLTGPLWLTVHALYWSEYERTLLIHTMADTMRKSPLVSTSLAGR